MTTGSLSCGSIVSTSTFNNGTNGMTTGSLSCTSITDSGTLSATSSFFNGTMLVGKASPIVATGQNKLQIYGTDSSASGPHMQFFTPTDVYPIMQILSWTHNLIEINFDCYNSNTGDTSSLSTSNFQIKKYNDVFNINYSSGNAQGSAVTFSSALAISNAGTVTIPVLSAGTISSTSQPCLIIYASSYISVTSATYTLFNGWNTTSSTQGGITYTTSTITVPSAGIYSICYEMAFDSTIINLGYFIQMYITTNGGATRYGNQLTGVVAGTQMYMSSSVKMKCSASDTLQVYVYQNTGANLHVGTLSGGYGRLEIAKLY
jgi:hypothetical protein